MLSTVASSLTVAAMAVMHVGVSDGSYSHSSIAFGKTYKSHVAKEVADKTPRWSNREENPPVSPREALKLADKMLRSIAKAPKGWKWQAMHLNMLLGENPCLWFVTYQGVPVEPEGVSSIPYHEITLIVLMDGTVIKPEITELRGRSQEDDLRRRNLVDDSEDDADARKSQD